MDCRWIKDGKGELIALLVPKEFKPEGYNFLTPGELNLQVGVNAYKAEGAVEAHRHNPVVRTTQGTMEAILVRRGRMSLQLYDNESQPLEQLEVGAGDFVLLVSGGHAITFLEQCDLLEVKQGPFVSREQDKTPLFAATGGSAHE
jgi:hypothetical protein